MKNTIKSGEFLRCNLLTRPGLEKHILSMWELLVQFNLLECAILSLLLN